MLMHGLFHLEILPGGQTGSGRPRATKAGKKAEGSLQDDFMDLDAAQAVVRQFDLNDLKALQRPLEHVNISVCFVSQTGAHTVKPADCSL